MHRVVLMAHGPGATTTAAVDRLRALGRPVHLVAGSRAAGRLRRHRSPLVEVVEGVGRTGLAAALAGFDELDAVLVLHDDVLLHADAATALLDLAAERPRTLVVPATNEPDTDGYVGQLPPDAAVPPGPGDVVPVERFRGSCLAGSRQVLTGLLEQRITAADTLVEVRSALALCATGVRATHLDRCVEQQVEPVGPDGRDLLVAALIVRDEEELLPECLASLEGLVDRIEVCDTGSTDRTVAIAREHGARVMERVWRDDFAWARNEVMAACRDAWWVLQVDADERVELADPVAFRRWLATAVDDPGAFRVGFHDILDGDRRGDRRHVERLVPAEARYVGALHELAQRPDGTPYLWHLNDTITLVHHGYRTEVVEARDKATRNIELARRRHEAEGDEDATYQLARTLRLRNDGDVLTEEAAGLHEELVTGIEAGTSLLNEHAQVTVLASLVGHRAATGDPAGAHELARVAVDVDPRSPLARLQLARTAVAVGAFDEAVALGHGPTDLPLGGFPDRRADAERAVEVAKAHLGREDADAARGVVEELLATPLPADFGAWLELVSLVALTAAARADELLRAPVLASSGLDALKAVVRTFHPEDGAEFAVAVATATDALHADLAGRGRVALAAAVAADRPDLVEELTGRFGLLLRDYAQQLAPHARQRGRAQVVAALTAV